MLKKMKRAISCLLVCALSLSFVGTAFADEITPTPDDINTVITSTDTDEIISTPNDGNTVITPDSTNDTTTPDDSNTAITPDNTDDTTAPSDIISDENEREQILENLKNLEYSEGSVRYALWCLGFDDESIDTLSWEELNQTLAEMEVYDMPGLVDTYSEISFYALQDKTQIKVRTGSGDSAYTVTYGGDTVSGSIIYDINNPQDLVITANDNYRIKSLTLEQGLYGDYTEGRLLDVETLISADGKSINASADLLKSTTGQAFESAEINAGGFGGKSYLLTFVVTVEKVKACEFTIKETGNGSGARYSLAYPSISNATATALQSSINTAISNSQIYEGDTLTFTVDTDKISMVKVNGEETTVTNGTFSMQAGSIKNEIEFIYKSTAGAITFSENSNIKENAIESWAYTFKNPNGTQLSNGTVADLAELNEEITKQYEGTVLDLTLTFADTNISLKEAKWNNTVVPRVTSRTISNLILTSDVSALELKVKTTTPILSVAVYDKMQNNALKDTNDVFVIARINNYDLLENPDSFISRPGFDYSVVNTTNTEGDKYKNLNTDCERAGAFWGMYFTPKLDSEFKFDYNFTVTARLTYDGTNYTRTLNDVTISKSN